MGDFFDLLPAELQVDIFQAWIGSECVGCCGAALRALSALDVACSNRALRRSWLQLIGKISFAQGTFSLVRTAVPLKCFGWLADRGVRVRSLGLELFEGEGIPSMAVLQNSTLPSVERIVISGTVPEGADSLWFAGLLRCCPQVSSLHFNDLHGSLDHLLKTLKGNVLTGLRRLTIHSYKKTPKGVLVNLLKELGPQLQEFRCNSNFQALPADALKIIRDTCPGLQVLEVNVGAGVSMDLLLSVLQALPLLRELTLIDLKGGLDNVHAVLHACPSIKMLELLPLSHPSSVRALMEFFEILAKHPQLDTPQVRRAFKYSRSSKHLFLHVGCWAGLKTAEQLDKLFSVCPAVTKLKIVKDCSCCSEGPLFAIISRYQDMLEDVDAHLDPKSFAAVLQCPALRRLYCHFEIDLKGADMDGMAVNCKQLEYLTINEQFDGFGITDSHLRAFLVACPLLREVHLTAPCMVTPQGLDVILDQRMALRRFSWCMCPNEDDGSPNAHVPPEGFREEFKVRARERQLLPVLCIDLHKNEYNEESVC